MSGMFGPPQPAGQTSGQTSGQPPGQSGGGSGPPAAQKGAKGAQPKRTLTPDEQLLYADNLGDGLAPGDVDPAMLTGIDAQHFAIKLGGPDGKAVGLFRAASDDDSETLALERLTPTGEWEEDPGLIDELHQPGCYAVDDNEAASIQGQLLSQP